MRTLLFGPRATGEWVVTASVLGANVVAFVAELALAGKASALWQMPVRPLLLLGANHAAAVRGELRLELLVTACFLHGSLLHIVFNLLALRSAGPLVEQAVGSARMAPMYVTAGIAGSLASAATGWATGAERLSIGASGAICGVIGAALVLGWRAHGPRGPVTVAMGRWLLIVLVIGFAAGFDNAAHLGGAVAGLLFGVLWRRGKTPTRTARAVALGASALVVAVAFAVALWHARDELFAALGPTG